MHAHTSTPQPTVADYSLVQSAGARQSGNYTRALFNRIGFYKF